MKIVTAPGTSRLTLSAPSVSSSSSGTFPCAAMRSISERRVPYRWPETYVTCSSRSPRSIRSRNSSRLRKWYSRPSSSPGRRPRVVAETLWATPGTRCRTSRISVPLPAPEGPVTTMTEGGLPVEEVNQLRALAIGEPADGLRLADATRVEEARRLHAAELRNRHEDVDHLRGRHVLGRIAEDHLDAHTTVFEVLLQLRATHAHVVRTLQCVHSLVERPEWCVCLRLRGRRHERPILPMRRSGSSEHGGLFVSRRERLIEVHRREVGPDPEGRVRVRKEDRSERDVFRAARDEVDRVLCARDAAHAHDRKLRRDVTRVDGCQRNRFQRGSRKAALRARQHGLQRARVDREPAQRVHER